MDIYNIKGLDGSEVSFCPSRGGIITSLKLKGKEVLYFDEETFLKKDSVVRGGIPILFPNAGELINNNLFPKLKRHGFARDLIWGFEKEDGKFEEILISDNQTKDVYEFDFKLSISGYFDDSNSFVLGQTVENTGASDLPISMGLHPYFKVPNVEKKNIKFNFEGGIEISEKFDVWANGGTVYLNNPKLNNPNSVISVEIPHLGTITMDVSSEYKKIWIWSQPGKDFICIEPMEGELNGIINNPEIIKPQGKINTYIKISLI